MTTTVVEKRELAIVNHADPPGCCCLYPAAPTEGLLDTGTVITIADGRAYLSLHGLHEAAAVLGLQFVDGDEHRLVLAEIAELEQRVAGLRAKREAPDRMRRAIDALDADPDPVAIGVLILRCGKHVPDGLDVLARKVGLRVEVENERESVTIELTAYDPLTPFIFKRHRHTAGGRSLEEARAALVHKLHEQLSPKLVETVNFPAESLTPLRKVRRSPKPKPTTPHARPNGRRPPRKRGNTDA